MVEIQLNNTDLAMLKIKPIKGLHFQPWVGKNYKKSPYGKLLLLGESHYLKYKSDDTLDLTSEVVMNHIDGTGKSPFFRKAGNAIDSGDWKSVWYNIAYANLIQAGLRNSKAQPTEKEKLTVNLALTLLLEKLKPEKVIVLSKRMWTEWLTEGSCKCVSFLNENDKKSEVWEYKYGNGKCLVMGTNHPSSRWFSSKDYSPLINKFLSMSPQ